MEGTKSVGLFPDGRLLGVCLHDGNAYSPVSLSASQWASCIMRHLKVARRICLPQMYMGIQSARMTKLKLAMAANAPA